VYENDQLIFEGEYLNGCRIKGKEYNDNVLIFDGEYLKGKKWSGKGYVINDNIIYELIKGKASDDKLIFVDNYLYAGDYLDNGGNGKGKKYYNGRLIFE